MDNRHPLSRRELLGDACRRVGGTALGIGAAAALQGCNRRKAQTPQVAAVPLLPSARFTDITVKAGLDFVQSFAGCGQHYFVEQVASGAALFDANGDGYLDIYFPQPHPLGECKSKLLAPLHHRLYLNDGKGNFVLSPNAFGGLETDYGIAVAVGDYDNDGHPDLYVCCYGKNRLFHNRGDGTFEDVTDRAGVGLHGFSTGAVWFDFDGDGHLDLFVSRYCEWSVERDKPCPLSDGSPDVCSPLTYTASTDVLFKNNGNGTFIDATHKAGIGLEKRRSLGVAAADFDGDGRLDLFVANDLGPNFLYRNLGDGTFEDVAMPTNVALGATGSPQANMGVAVGDYNGDGRLDVLVTTFADEPYTLYRNDGIYFTNVTSDVGLYVPTLPFLGFGTGFFDALNRGYLDLFFANGHVSPYTAQRAPDCGYKQRNQLFLYTGRDDKNGNEAGRFIETHDALPKDDIRVHRGAYFGDIDNDGKIDILVTASNDRPTLLHNDSPPSNWLMLQLTNASGCVTPVGVRCTATLNGRKLLRVVLGGGSYAGSSDYRVHFGLGTATKVDDLEIVWLSGKKTLLKDVAANQILPVREG